MRNILVYLFLCNLNVDAISKSKKKRISADVAWFDDFPPNKIRNK